MLLYDKVWVGVGSQPSQTCFEWVMTEEEFTFKRLNDGPCNWELHDYDWPLRNAKTHRNGLRRMWFVKKTTETKAAVWP